MNVTIVALVARVSTDPLSFRLPTEVDVGLMQYVIKAQIDDPRAKAFTLDATNKIDGISDDAAAFLHGFF